MLATHCHHPIDDTVSAMPELLDEDRVLEACVAQWNHLSRSSPSDWQTARRIETLYHPGRYARVVYVFLVDPDTPETRYWPEGQLVHLRSPVRESTSRRGSVIRLGGHRVEAYAFPNDRRLRGVRGFSQREQCCAFLQRWLKSDNAETRCHDASLQRLFVRYVPEQKWIIRLRAEAGSPNDAGTTKHRIAVRASTPRSVETLAARHRALVETDSGSSDRFRIPRVVAVEGQKGLLATEWVRGEGLVDHLRANGPDDLLGRLARCLHALHGQTVPRLPRIGTAEIVQRMASATSDLAAAHPPQASHVRNLARHFAALVANVDLSNSATLHNDFHWKQVSIKRNRIVLFDLERMAVGDPLIDVAQFAAQLQMLGHRTDVDLDRATAEVWCRTFLQAWDTTTGCRSDERTICCLQALARMELARGMMRHLRPGWLELTERCIHLAQTELEEAYRRT